MIKDWAFGTFSAREKQVLRVFERKTSAFAAVGFEPFLLPSFAYQEMVFDYEKMNLDANRIFEEMVAQGNDTPPFINTFCSVGMVAEAFGGSLVFPSDGGYPWVSHVTDDVEVACEIAPKPLRELCYYQRLRGWIDYSQRINGTEFPFWTIDIQSPFSVAAQVVEPQELFIACITNPVAVHKLLLKITEYTILLHYDHMCQMEHVRYPGRNFPSVSQNIGICIADDTPAIMLSEELYREFALPYNNMLAHHFGGVSIHCCGGYMKKLPVMLETQNLCAIQLHAGAGEFVLPTSPNEHCGFNMARDSVAIFVDTNPISRGDEYAQDTYGFYQKELVPALQRCKPSYLLLDCCKDIEKGLSGAAAYRQTNDFLKQVYW